MLVRCDDVRALYRLLGETREITRVETEAAAKTHAIRGLCGIVGGCVGAIVVDDDHGSLRRGRLVEMNGHNVEGADLLNMAREYLENGPVIDPALARFRTRHAPVVTLTRRELVDDRKWFGSPFVSDTRRRARLDDAIYSKRQTGRPNTIDSLCVNRPWGDRPFEAEDRNLVHLFHLESGWLYSPAPSKLRPRARDRLRPREKQTLTLLLAGAAEKEIARELDLSIHTVHGYVKNIYARCGTSSRAQLMALALDARGASDALSASVELGARAGQARDKNVR
jgi:DNA-binding CsgD family transcriptional regulator